MRENTLARTLLGRVADIYIANSTSTFNLLAKLGIKTERIRLLRNGVDSEFFLPNEKERAMT